MHDNDDGKPITSSGPNKPCLHCLIRETIDAYAEHMHTTTGKKVNIHDTVDDLLGNVCEILAWVGDAKVRKSNVKHYQNLLAGRTRLYREIGRYPGGPWTQEFKALASRRRRPLWPPVPRRGVVVLLLARGLVPSRAFAFGDIEAGLHGSHLDAERMMQRHMRVMEGHLRELDEVRPQAVQVVGIGPHAGEVDHKRGGACVHG